MTFGENFLGAIESFGERLVNHRTAELTEAGQAVFGVPSSEISPVQHPQPTEVYPITNSVAEVVPIAPEAVQPATLETATQESTSIDQQRVLAQVYTIHDTHGVTVPDFKDPHMFEDKVAA